MKIKNISCTQFAGVRDRNVSFDDGINVIYGKNESGKSTLVNLISRTLFQDARLNRNKDKEFFELYFPAALKDGSFVGDFADGRITFETEKGTYTLSKEWGADSRCTLSTPDGVIRDTNIIEEILKDALLYGEGVYSDLLFSSQRNTDVALQTILDASKKNDTKKEITEAVSQAFAEGDGISVDAVEQAIVGKIEEIAGAHWDIDRNAPVRKSGGGRYQKQLGKILEAYYALEDAKSVLEEISALEAEADRAANAYAEKDAAVSDAKEAYDNFKAFANRLMLQSERKKSIEKINKEKLEIAKDLSCWPQLEKSLAYAKALQTEKESRIIADKYEAAKKINDEIETIDGSFLKLPCPSGNEIMQVRTAQRGILSLENKLCGMNLKATVNMLGNNTVEVRSLRTGEIIDISDGTSAVTEAVKITVPGVMEMQLSPADVDVSAVEALKAEQKKIIADIFAKYKVDSSDSLESLARDIADAKTRSATAKSRLAVILGEISFEELEMRAKEIPSALRSKEEVERDIYSVCGASDAARFITVTETTIEGYIARYGSITELEEKAAKLDAELENEKENLSDTEDIPAEYRNIPDPAAYLDALHNALENRQSLRETALTVKTAAASRLETKTEEKGSVSDLAETVNQAEQALKEQKSLLSHWLHIAEVFRMQKDNIRDNPMQDIADRFTRYLGIVSGGKVSSDFPEADKLNMNIYSSNRLLDYGKLSEGTKETVSLAFRLAVLDHLFPDGGGVIVFDDPFTDMDADRTAQSCQLIKECAARHQVIFLTCREEYLTELQGKSIIF